MDSLIKTMTPFSGKTILVTGATGLIGQNLVRSFLQANQLLAEPIQVYALVRDFKKASALFGNDEHLCYLTGDMRNLELPSDLSVDYVIHAASQTSSKAFVSEPVETILTAVLGTRQLLEYAKTHPVLGFVYLSSMEVYGSPSTDEKIAEDHATNLDTTKVRSCYPESKRLCESLCAAYASEYGVPTRIVRLTQTFGPGVAYEDGRVFAEFARCVIEGKDILLHTLGETRRNYLYTADAVTAILTVLHAGENGTAYNAANEETYCSILEMAQMVADKFAAGSIAVRIEVEDEAKYGFAPVLHMNLDTSRLQKLGWHAEYNLESMFRNLIEDMKAGRDAAR